VNLLDDDAHSFGRARLPANSLTAATALRRHALLQLSSSCSGGFGVEEGVPSFVGRR
jgi:hypothetical protein